MVVAKPLLGKSGRRDNAGDENFVVAPTLDAHYGDKQGLDNQHINSGGGCSLPPISLCLNAGGMGRQDSETETLIPSGGAFEVAHTLPAAHHSSDDGTGRGTPLVPTLSAVRRLTPTECERLQGFPDGYTAIPSAKDGPRYKALGNSMAVPCMRWIGERIQMVENLISGAPDAH